MRKFIFAIFLALFFLAGCAQQAQVVLPENSSAEKISILVEVNAGEEKLVGKTLEVEQGTNAFEALKQATDVEFKQYDFGVFVTSVAGRDAGQSSYWALYINGVYSEKSIDQVMLEKDSKIRLELEEIV